MSALEHSGGCRLILLSQADQIRAVALRQLVGRYDVALHWIRVQQCQKWRWKPGIAEDVDVCRLQDLERQWLPEAPVQHILNTPGCKDRVWLDRFIAEFEVQRHVHRLHGVGLRVPSAYVLSTYAAACARRGMSQAGRSHVEGLRENPNTAKKWSRAFRSRWSLEWGAGHVQHGLHRSDQEMRAAVFLRWMRWVLAELSAIGAPVVVNMDETLMSNIGLDKKGVVANMRRCAASAGVQAKRMRPLPRTSLLAAISNDVSVQRALPQLRLPRRMGAQAATRPQLDAYGSAGAPQMAMHGGSGWNNTAVMKIWCRALRKAVSTVAPGRPLVLVMDDCSIHICDEIVAQCTRLRIALCIVPARMTWLLQPLDTHVFSRLKAALRKNMFEALAARGAGSLSTAATVRLQGSTIRQVIVDGDWSEVMSRAGLSDVGGELRPSLRDMLGSQDTGAACPTAAELANVLQIPAVRSERLRAALLGTVTAAATAPPAQPMAAAAAVPAAAPVADPVILVAPRLRLSSRARLPAAPRPAGTATNFILATPRRSPVITRSRSAAALVARGSAAASSSAS